MSSMLLLLCSVASIWRCVEPSRDKVGPFWSYVEPAWGQVGRSWGHVGPMLGHLGAMLGQNRAQKVPNVSSETLEKQ